MTRHTVGVQLIAQLRDEHDLIDAVAGAFRTFASPGSGAPSAADGLAFLQFFRLYAGSYHHAREEEVLFAVLVDRLELPRERGPIAVLIDDHRRMSSQLATIERLLVGELTTGGSRAALSRAVDAYVTSLAHHIDAENSVLLPESEGRLLKRNIRELPSREPTPDESAARDLGHRLVARYPPSRRDTIMRGDGCVLCPAMGESCAGLELEWWNEWEWEEAEDHLPSG